MARPTGDSKNTIKSSRLHQTIKPPHAMVGLNLRELLQYRNMVIATLYRDFRMRYTQTILGPIWGMLTPFFTMIIYTIVFGSFAKMPSENLPYPIFNYSALVPWTLVSTGMGVAMNSLHSNYTILSRIYFPRLVLPIHGVLYGWLDFLFSMVILFGMMLFFGYYPTVRVLLLPFFLLPGLATALGLGAFFAILSVHFRDIRYLISHLTQALLYASPIVYPMSVVPPAWKPLILLNPFTVMVMGFRWSLLGTNELTLDIFVQGTTLSLVVLTVGLYVFRRFEANALDSL